MKEGFKVSGKKFNLGEKSQPNWKVTRRPGGWTLVESPQGTRHRLFLDEHRGHLGVLIQGQVVNGSLHIESRHGAATSGGVDADLVAQFPGKVRKILVTAGSQVKEGDPLLLVEAMKMEFSVKAPFDGKVVGVLVKEGQQLNPGDRFFELEETKKSNGE